MLKAKQIFTWDKYAKIEVAFLVIIKIIMPLLSDLEYGLKEQPTQFTDEPIFVSITRRVVWGIFQFVPFYLFYKLAIQQLLVAKKYVYFLLSLLLFIAFLEFYTIRVMYWSIAHSGFLPKAMVTEAAKWMKIKSVLHFTINYLILQLLELVALAYFIDYDKQEKKIQELQRIQTASDLQYLKAQLQPHFFFNTLNNIYSLALQRSELTAPLVAKLSSMMRYILYETASTITLQDELNFLENYMDVQSVRYNKKIDLVFDVQAIDRKMPMQPLLLFPFIENAFKHGIEEEAGSGFIHVVICLTENELILSVRNSKAAHTNNPEHKKGIGIMNTQKRLALLYPGKHELNIQETDDTYSVFLTITLN